LSTIDQLERYLADAGNRDGDFVVVARPTRSGSSAVASMTFTRDRPRGVPLPSARRYLTIGGRRLQIDAAELAALGWTASSRDSDTTRSVFWRPEPLGHDPAELAGHIRDLAASVLRETDLSISIRGAAGTARMNARRDEALEEVGFAFGMFFLVIPVSAAITAVAGVVLGIVSFVEAIIAFALTIIFLKLVIDSDRGSPRDRGRRLGGVLYALIVRGTAEVVAQLARVPPLRPVATLIGVSLVLWLPAAVLAIVGLVLRALPKI
jgi:hypothetical protein